jgi:hypothetical protein
MAVNFTMSYTDRVKVLPKATLNDGSEVSDYAEAMVVDLHGVSGNYSSVYGSWVSFISPSDKGPAGYVPWSSLSAGALPDFAKTAAQSWSGSVSAQVVAQIEQQFNAPINETVPDWAG